MSADYADEPHKKCCDVNQAHLIKTTVPTRRKSNEMQIRADFWVAEECKKLVNPGICGWGGASKSRCGWSAEKCRVSKRAPYKSSAFFPVFWWKRGLKNGFAERWKRWIFFRRSIHCAVAWAPGAMWSTRRTTRWSWWTRSRAHCARTCCGTHCRPTWSTSTPHIWMCTRMRGMRWGDFSSVMCLVAPNWSKFFLFRWRMQIN